MNDTWQRRIDGDLYPQASKRSLILDFVELNGFQSFEGGNFKIFLQFKVKIFKNSSKFLHIQLDDHFPIILSQFGLDFATILLIFEVWEVKFCFYFILGCILV